MIEQRSDRRLGVLHQLLVKDPVNALRNGPIPVLHELDVIGVIAAEVHQVVAEILPNRESPTSSSDSACSGRGKSFGTADAPSS